jgi:hypothetical protein
LSRQSVKRWRLGCQPQISTALYPQKHLLSLQPPTKMSTRNRKKSFWGVERGRRVSLTTSRLFRQCGILIISQTYRPSRPVTGNGLRNFTYIHLFTHSFINGCTVLCGAWPSLQFLDPINSRYASLVGDQPLRRQDSTNIEQARRRPSLVSHHTLASGCKSNAVP